MAWESVGIPLAKEDTGGKILTKKTRISQAPRYRHVRVIDRHYSTYTYSGSAL